MPPPAAAAAFADSGPVALNRIVRFCVNPAAPLADLSDARHNTFAAWPSMMGLGAYYELHITCRGEPDQRTGYLVNISTIDEAVRRTALPIIARAAADDPAQQPAGLLPEIVNSLQRELARMLASVRWQLTPYHAITMDAETTDRVLISQHFEFAAAHRLHVDGLSEQENRSVFGRCNNPNFHGHNYRLEVAAEAKLSSGRPGFGIRNLERIVSERIIKRFDHTNLNIDVPEFASVNPSVENITRLCHALLHEPIAEAGGRLAYVTVWETEKTSATYGASPRPALPK